jgi:hypothetical protein
MMEITLTDHMGESPSGIPVDHDQWIVFVDDVQVGYLSKTPGSWLQSIVFMDAETTNEVVAEINKKLQAEIGGVAMPVDPDLEPKEDDDE